jgi:hypothetical protein
VSGGDRDVAVQRQPTATAPEENVTEMPAVTVTGERGQYKTRVVQGLNLASTRARVNAASYAIEVLHACDAFKVYAEPKLKDLEDEITAGDLAEAVLGVALAVVGGQATSRIVNKIGQEVAKEISKRVSKAMTDSVKKAGSNKKDTDDLRKAVQSLSMGLQDASTLITEGIGQILDPRIQGIVDKVNNNEPLTGEDNDLAGIFYIAGPEVIDEILERDFGIPSIASAKQIHLRLYSGLVEKFEEKYIWATASFREKLEMGFASDFGATELTLAYKAGRAAAAATAERRRQLEGAGGGR